MHGSCFVQLLTLFFFFSVCLLPSGPVVNIPGRNQSFTCQLFSAAPNTHLQNVSWLLNGSTLENYGLDNVVTSEFKPGPISMGGGGILRFVNLSLENNYTTIQCQATLQSNVTQSASEGVLLLQGMKVTAREGHRSLMPLKKLIRPLQVTFLFLVHHGRDVFPDQGDAECTYAKKLACLRHIAAA